VDSSRVYHIEGEAPEGVELGDVANYFNAELRDKMLVVSWTGDEVEFYQGITLSAQAVVRAFGVSDLTPSARRWSNAFNREARLDGDGAGNFTNYLSFGKFIKVAATVGIGLVILYGQGFLPGRSSRVAAPVKKIAAAPAPLVVGASGRWQETKYRIATHVLMELAEPGVIFSRHEYLLMDDLGQPTLLACGDSPGAADWMLYTPLTPLQPPTSLECAAKKSGDTVNIDGVVATISKLFQATVRGVDDAGNNRIRMGDVAYGYVGRSESGSLLVRWDKGNIQFYRGKKVSPKEFTAAFAAASGN
jgi:hypothetical protein